jgi:hypothetical protein
MSIDRTLILKGPAKLVHDTATIFSEDDVSVAFITDYFAVNTSAFGVVGQRVQSRRIEVTCTPKMWSDLTKLYPYATSAIGSAIFGATDKPLVITPVNGAPLTLANAAITQLPGITLSHGKPMLRPLKFTALCANSANPATPASWFSFGTAATGVALTGFDLTKVYNTRYSLLWNTVTYRSEEGFAVDFNLGLAPDVIDGEGVVNYRITDLGAAIKFVPTANTEAEFATLLGWNKAPGASPAFSNAVITGEGTGSPIITIANALVAQGNSRYGPSVGRHGEIELQAVRSITAGALDALWTFAANT